MPLISLESFDRTLTNAQEYQKLQAYVPDIEILKSRLQHDGLDSSHMYRTLQELTFSLRKDIRQHNELFELFFVLMRTALDFEEHFVYNTDKHVFEGAYGERMQQLLAWLNTTVVLEPHQIALCTKASTAQSVLKPYFNK